MSLLVFLTVLSVLVVVHEWGHFITARLLGVKVEKFSVGFGPKLFSWKRGDTEYMVCLIPLGGFVKMAGDERAECKGTPDEYYSHPPGHRALIVLNGPMVNFVFAYLCFYVTFVIGYPVLSPKIGKVMEGYPAQVAQMKEGDKVLAINGAKIESWEELQKQVMTSKSGSLEFTLERGGQVLTSTIVPQDHSMTNIFGQEEKVRIIGVHPMEEVTFLKYGLVASLGKAAQQLIDITVITYKSLYHVVTGAIPAKDAFAGPIRIFDVIADAASLGFSYLLFIMAIISASLAIFNLFPIPVLDGGHLFLLAIEKVRGRPLPAKIEDWATRVGLSLLLCLMVFVFYNDMAQKGWFDKIRDLWQTPRSSAPATSEQRGPYDRQ